MFVFAGSAVCAYQAAAAWLHTHTHTSVCIFLLLQI